MKKLLKSYITFTRTERIGLLCLSGVLVILLIVRATMYLWVQPDNNEEQNKKLIASWQVFKRSQPTQIEVERNKNPTKEHQDAMDENTSPLPDIIDLNTADSATLVRLKGIGPVTAGKIVARRKNKGPFTNIDQLSETGAFNSETLSMLKKHLIINQSPKQ